MRFYAFTNFYLSSIQHGIQAGHVTNTMETKYARDKPGYATARAALNEWRDRHLTYIILNGGCAPLIHHRKAQFRTLMNACFLPWNAFNEPGLEGALTAYGGVITPDIYEEDLSESQRTCSFDVAFDQWAGKLAPPDDEFRFPWTPQLLLTKFIRMHAKAT